MQEMFNILDNVNEPLFIVLKDRGEVVYTNQALKKLMPALADKEKFKLQEIAFLQTLYQHALRGYKETVSLPESFGLFFNATSLDLEYQNQKASLVRLDLDCGDDFLLDTREGNFYEALFYAIFSCKNLEDALDQVVRLLVEHYKAGKMCVQSAKPFNNADGTPHFSELCHSIGGGRHVKISFSPEIVTYLENKRSQSIDYFKTPLVVQNIEEVVSDKVLYDFMQESGIENFIYCPLSLNEGAKAYFCCANLDKDAILDAKEHLGLTAKLISFILNMQAQLQESQSLSIRDSLTHALNRRAYEKYLTSWHFDTTASCIVVDIIDLRGLNKRKGYRFGDSVLKSVYTSLLTLCHNFEIFRQGSDNFVCLNHGLSKSDFAQVVVRLRALFHCQGYEVVIGESWTDDKCTATSLIKRAEESLNEEQRKLGASCHVNFIEQDNLDIPISEEGTQVWKQVLHHHARQDPFYNYLESNYYDALTVIKSLSAKNLPLYLCFGDLHTRMYYISDSFKDTFGFDSNLVHDFILRLSKLMPLSEDQNAVMEMILSREKSAAAYRQHALMCRITKNGGDDIWLRFFGFTSYDKNTGFPIFFTGFALRLDDSYAIDKVTNLPGEFAVQVEIDNLLHSGQKAKIFALSLNRMPEVFDTVGRDAGQRLLGEIASRSISALSQYAHFYHLGQRSFVAIENKEAIDDVTAFSEKWREVVGTCYETFGFSSKHAASIALLSCPEDIITANDALDKIAYFISIAKTESQDFIRLNENKLYEQRYQAKLLFELTNAVENNFAGFSTVIQPIVSAQTHKISGGEILLRYFSEGQVRSPALFIPALERSELIIDVGRYVFEEAAKSVKRIRKTNPDFYLSFNVSYVQVRDDPSFIDFMKEILDRYDLPGNAFVVELTETNFDAYPERLAEFLDRCHKLNMRFALDDFGNGYSSLNLLLKYPVNIVKLDKSLTERITTSKDILSFMKSVIYACHRFGKQVVVEGVETIEELKAIDLTSVDYIQGFYFHRPMPHHEVEAKVMEEYVLKEA